jgi:hypothetical protein
MQLQGAVDVDDDYHYELVEEEYSAEDEELSVSSSN